MKKYPISFRLTEQAQELLKKMSDLLGVSQVAVLELAIREKAQRTIQDVSSTEKNINTIPERINS